MVLKEEPRENDFKRSLLVSSLLPLDEDSEMPVTDINAKKVQSQKVDLTPTEKSVVLEENFNRIEVVEKNLPTSFDNLNDNVHDKSEILCTARAGRKGLSITMVSPYDTERVLAIEKIINSKMTEFELEEEKIIKILTQVQVM